MSKRSPGTKAAYKLAKERYRKERERHREKLKRKQEKETDGVQPSE